MVKKVSKATKKTSSAEIVETLKKTLTRKSEQAKPVEKKEEKQEPSPIPEQQVEEFSSNSSSPRILIDSPTSPLNSQKEMPDENLENIASNTPISKIETNPASLSYSNFSDYSLSYSSQTYATMDNQLMNKDIEKRSLGMTLNPSSDSQVRPINQRIWQEQIMGSQWDAMQTRTGQEKEYTALHKPKKNKDIFEN